MIIACATDDGKNFIDRHFGDADYYMIYELTKGKFVLIDQIVNTSGEEKQHADPVKAKGIIDLLLEKKVQVSLTKVFGANINKVKKHIVPIIISTDDINSGLEKVLENINMIEDQIASTDEKSPIDLR